jgi:hypothetical protein
MSMPRMFFKDREAQPWIFPVCMGIAFVAGVVVGNWIAEKPKPEPKFKRRYVFEEDLEEEIEDLEEELEDAETEIEQLELDVVNEGKHMVKTIIQEEGDDIVERIGRELHAHVIHEDPRRKYEKEHPEQEHVWPDPEWDYEEELKHRDPKKPYIIHRDEFEEDEYDKDPRQTTITYYRGDDVLVDEGMQVIYRPETVVGVLEFGKGSGDPNVCFVRNEELDAEYEVLLDPGYYYVEVLGGTPPENPKPHKTIHKFMD